MLTGQTAALGGGAPARHGAHGAGGVLLPVVRQADGVNHGAAEVSGFFQIQDADIVVDGPAVIVGVEVDSGHSNVLLVGIVVVKVVVSNSDSESAGGLSVTAVTSSHHLVGGDERAATHEGAAHSSSEQSDLVGELPGCGRHTSNNLPASPGHGGRQELGGQLLGGSGRQGHHTEDYCCSHSDQLILSRCGRHTSNNLP